MAIIDAVLLDVGGVLLLPDPDVLAPALDAAEVAYDAVALASAHYGGVRGLDDETPSSSPTDEEPGGYLRGFMSSARIPESQQQVAAQVLRNVFARPSVDVWRRTTPWARDGLAMLARLGTPTAIVSNADGTVERQLELHGLAQVGQGPGLAVAAIVDSDVVGIRKPDPALFEPALAALGRPPERCAYIGDTVIYDVTGARAAGLLPVHLDPWGSCSSDSHPHAVDLQEAVDTALAR